MNNYAVESFINWCDDISIAQEGLFEKKDKPPVDAKKAESLLIKIAKEIIQESYNFYDDNYNEDTGWKVDKSFKPPYQLTYNKSEDDNSVKYLIYPKGNNLKIAQEKKGWRNLNFNAGSIIKNKYKKEAKQYGIRFSKANKDSCCLIVYFNK